MYDIDWKETVWRIVLLAFILVFYFAGRFDGSRINPFPFDWHCTMVNVQHSVDKPDNCIQYSKDE